MVKFEAGEVPMTGKIHEKKLIIAFSKGLHILDPLTLKVLDKITLQESGN